MKNNKKALIMLENGYYEYGRAFASEGTNFSEFVFNTSMTGYEEILTDPSYKGQTVLFTNPLIGNYGITNEDFQSEKIQAEGILIREYSRIASNHRSKIDLASYLEKTNTFGIDRIDTRAFTKVIRQFGAMKGGITTEVLDPEEFLKQVKASHSISDVDLYKLVISDKVEVFEGNPSVKEKIIAIDFGIKNNIIKDLQSKFNKIYLVPFDDNFEANIADLDYDGVFLSNGPGDPRIVKGIDKFIKQFAENNIPLIAICFGHQLIGQAFGLKTIKLPFGHHGGNHPVKYFDNGRVYITAQNHNYAISNESLEADENWEMTWVNLYDHTVEGMKHKHLPINCIQFHPEASPGPREANEKVFKDFYKTVAKQDK
ncbi:MAG: glutamine-hydrolyzing carbamoyl-phosphate synthase small subunit [Candidatus Kapaibacterium sp.]